MTHIPKYARLENERRFLVENCPDLSEMSFRLIDDLDITGTRLRLRMVSYGDGKPTEFKLCKKYQSDSSTSVPIVNVYLAENEHTLLSQLPGRALRKRRYELVIAEIAFAIDVFEPELMGLVLCETESHSVEELANITLPPWAATEVTSDPFFNGGNLSCVERVELAEKIHALRTIG